MESPNDIFCIWFISLCIMFSRFINAAVMYQNFGPFQGSVVFHSVHTPYSVHHLSMISPVALSPTLPLQCLILQDTSFLTFSSSNTHWISLFLSRLVIVAKKGERDYMPIHKSDLFLRWGAWKICLQNDDLQGIAGGSMNCWQWQWLGNLSTSIALLNEIW